MQSFGRTGIMLGALLFASMSLAAQEGTNQNHSTTKTEKKMSVTKINQKNKETVRRLYEDCLNKRTWELISTFIAEDYEGVNGVRGPLGFTQPVKMVIQGFPDIQWKIIDLLEDGDKVAVRWTWEGKHEGTFNVYDATQKKVVNEGMAIFQFKDDKIIRQWIITDRLGFLQQIDVLPQDLGVQPQVNK